MKQFAQSTFLFFILAAALPACAVQKHHPGPADAATGQPTLAAPSPSVQADTAKMDAVMRQMRDTRMKMQAATDPAEKKRLMRMHMQQMQEGMKMMGAMGMMAGQDMGKKPMAGHDMSKMAMGGQDMKKKPMGAQEMRKMPANERMAMMEKKMAGMEQMMGPGGMMEGMMADDGQDGNDGKKDVDDDGDDEWHDGPTGNDDEIIDIQAPFHGRRHSPARPPGLFTQPLMIPNHAGIRGARRNRRQSGRAWPRGKRPCGCCGGTGRNFPG